MVIFILIVLGLCLGSFTNAFVYRFQRQAELSEQSFRANQKQAKNVTKASTKQQQRIGAELKTLSISRGRSMCVHCKHPLAGRDLVPVISYALLRGRCRYCRRPIPDTPLPELLTPLLFVVSYIFWPLPLTAAGGQLIAPGLVLFVFWLLFLVGFVILSLYDFRWFELPHRIVLPLIGIALLQVAIMAVLYATTSDSNNQTAINNGSVAPSTGSYVANSLVGGLVGGGIFGLLYALSPKQAVDDGAGGTVRISRWIGGGDITLGLLLGLLLGSAAGAVDGSLNGLTSGLLLIFVASLLGTLVAVPLLLTGRANRTSHLPFGPYLMLAAVIVLLFGNALANWYTRQLIV